MALAGTATQKQQRARQQLSCTACRTGKLKCNRQHPCDQCLKRSKETSCEYLAAPQRKKQNRNTKDRIAHLEGLVVQLMNRDSVEGSSAPVLTPPLSERDRSQSANGSEKLSTIVAGTKDSPQSDDSSDHTSQEFSYLRISNGGHSSYRGGSHWEAILDSIADLRDELNEENPDDDEILENGEEPERNTAQNVVIGAPIRMSKAELFASIPSRNVADRLLWYWFNSTDPSLPMIHRPTFLTQYDRFWADSSLVSGAWLSLLFSIMSLGARIASFAGNEGHRPSILEHLSGDQYQELAASALALADFTKPQHYLVEALMAHAACEYMKFNKGNGVWLLMSFVIRMALKMGYHRDPDNFPSISPFQGEMRRRVWNIVYTFDVLQSYSEGLPNMIRQVHSDTKSPRNLLDTDFGPDSKVLPAGRPLTELSPISYGVVKNRLSKVFAQACDFSQDVQAPDYDEIMVLNRELQDVYENTPPALRFSSMHQAIFDPPNLIFNRFKLELIFHKTRCCLHRRYMTQDVVGTKSELSRKLCVDAATSILKHHETIFNAAQDGGQLSQSRFYIASLNSADFLLAAMVLCLEVHLINNAPSPALQGPNQDRIEEMRSLLERSHNIWKQPVNHFANTDKASKAMEVMLKRMPLKPGTYQPLPKIQSRNEPLRDKADSQADAQAETSRQATEPTPNDALVIGGLYGNLPNGNVNLYEPISSMFPATPGNTDVDWNSFDKMVFEYPDPDQLNLGWPNDLGDLNIPSIPDLSSSTLGPGLTTTPEWSSVSAQDHNIAGAGVMPFHFTPSGNNVADTEQKRIQQLFPGFS